MKFWHTRHAIMQQGQGFRSETPSNGSPGERRHPDSEKGVSPVPDGGIRAWLQVLGAFFLFFNTW